jgi:hypothetical protein
MRESAKLRNEERQMKEVVLETEIKLEGAQT